MRKVFVLFLIIVSSAKLAAQNYDFQQRIKLLESLETLNNAYNQKDYAFVENFFKDVLYLQKNEDIQWEKADINNYLHSVQLFMRENSIFKMNDIEIQQSSRDKDIYSATYQHEWTSEHYSNSGYMFILFDLCDNSNPIVQICVWATGKDINKDSLPTLYDFPTK